MNLKCICEGNSIKTMTIFNVQFFDTMLYFPCSLEKLSKNFGLTLKKTIFPYKFPTFENLDYNGKVPDKEYFKN